MGKRQGEEAGFLVKKTVLRVSTPETQALRDDRLGSAKRSNKKTDKRTEGRRDLDRLTYSTAWRRLAGITQVVSPSNDGMVLHNRLTHSEKVAQLGVSIANNLLQDASSHEAIAALGGIDVDVVAAAAMAHDLGHPPFGHAGEAALDRVARKYCLNDGFEGNAQSIRICSALEPHKDNGMDLTRATIAAISKYPWTRALGGGETGAQDRQIFEWRKFSFYETERDLLAWSRTFLPSSYPSKAQTLEASIMDVADDITYAIHDLEDFYFAGLLHPKDISDQLLQYLTDNKGRYTDVSQRLRTEQPSLFDAGIYSEAIDTVRRFIDGAFPRTYKGARSDDANVRMRCAFEISELLARVALDSNPAEVGLPFVRLDSKAWHEVQILKDITRNQVIELPAVALVQRSQQRIIEDLVDLLMAWAGDGDDRQRLPVRLREGIEEALAADTVWQRAVVDYVCSLTDESCTAIQRILSGDRLVRPGELQIL